jgi:hypothetical protein
MRRNLAALKKSHEPLVSVVAVCKAIQDVQRATTKERTPEWYVLNRALHAVWALPTRKAIADG